MKLLTGLLAASAGLFIATGASATATISYGTVGSIDPNATIYADYDTVNPTPSGGLLQISGPSGVPGEAAPVGSGNFAYVVGGSNVSYTFDRAARSVSFDAGSIDPYNYINLTFTDGTSQAFGGPFGPFTPSDSARLTFTSASGARIEGMTFGSGGNSFEFDNVALAGVPEPAVWGMMILGFGIVGGALRTRRKVALAA